MWQEQLEAVGRRNKAVVFAFALSLLLHASILFFVARDAARDFSFILGLNLEPASIDVRLIPAQDKRTPVAKLRSEQVQSDEKSLPPPVNPPHSASKSVASPRSTIPKLVDLKTGDQLNLSYWRGVKIQGRPIRIRLNISPAGLIAGWELLTPGAGSLQLDLEAMNIMVRNMDANKTGETHVLIWESQVGKKNGELIAKIYLSSDD